MALLMQRRYVARLGALLAAGLMLTATLPARADASLEYAVKAAYLTKFIPFIRWPQASAAATTICVLGNDPFGGALERAASALKAGAHPVAVRHVEAPDSACQILFLDLPDPAAQASVLASLKGEPVLTVTDSGAPSQGVIGFVIAENHVRFDIDDALAQQNGLSISSKLLDLAYAVRRRGQP